MEAAFRFYAQLNDFLPPRRRQRSFRHVFELPASVKDMIESLGVPHTEIDLILANGEPVDFAYRVQDGDRIAVYPPFRTLDLGPLARVRPDPPDGEPRFVLDAHLGRLASYLRMLGFDALYRNDYADPELARIASEEDRVLLTRDRGLLKRSVVVHGYCLRATNPRAQLVEVLRRFDLAGRVAPFRRCIRCNGLLEAVDKAAIADRLPPRTATYYDEFHQCRACGQVYWKGAHTTWMEQFIASVLAEVG